VTPTVTATPAYADVRNGKLFSYPNPYKPGGAVLCTFRFQPCSVAKLELYDIAARKVGDISAAQIQASNGVAFWDGRLYNNTFAAPGLYLAILRSDGGILTTKLTVIR
jgi:hypothetical protein